MAALRSSEVSPAQTADALSGGPIRLAYAGKGRFQLAPLELSALVPIQSTNRVRRRERVERFVTHERAFTTSRSRSSPSRIRVFTVPSGCLSRSAISVWVSPT